VFDIVEQTIIHQEENRVFERHAPLGDELLILLRTPIKRFHHGRSYQDVCLLASIMATWALKGNLLGRGNRFSLPLVEKLR
jgi:hypothetical protein